MTVFELMCHLRDIAEAGYGDCEVIMATQPNYPVATTIGSVTAPDALAERLADDDDDDQVHPGRYVEEVQPGDETSEEEDHGISMRFRPNNDLPSELQVVWLGEGGSWEHPYAPRQLFE